MNLPRLVLADERKSNLTPPSVLLLAAMKRAGFPLRVFYCGLDSLDICLLKNAMEEEITVLHPKACANPKNMKILFELAASPDKLNVIVCGLGQRGATYLDSTKSFMASDIAAMFDCSIIMCCYAESIPAPVSKIVMGFVEGLESKNNGVRVDGIVFINPFNQRSFQLVENSVGLTFRGLSFGYIPQELEPPMPKYENICSPVSNSKSTFLIRAATTRISQMFDQIDYPSIEAIGKYNQNWDRVGGIEPIKRTTLPTVAVIDDLALSSEGNNAELLFRAFGCKVQRLSANEAFSQNFDVYYFPHGLGYMALDSFNAMPNLVQKIKSAFLSKKIIIANGASTPIFAEKVVLPDESENPGIGVLPGTGVYTQELNTLKSVPAQCESMSSGMMMQYKEKIGGYIIPWAKLQQPASMQKVIANWLCSPVSGKGALESAGWETERGIFAGVALDLWSNSEAVRRIFYAKV